MGLASKHNKEKKMDNIKIAKKFIADILFEEDKMKKLAIYKEFVLLAMAMDIKDLMLVIKRPLFPYNQVMANVLESEYATSDFDVILKLKDVLLFTDFLLESDRKITKKHPEYHFTNIFEELRTLF